MTAARRELLRFEVPLGVLGASLIAFAFVFARTGIPVWIPPAALVRAGVASPLTGMTRSFVSFARGDVATAFAWHPLGPLCFVACVGLAVYAVLSFARRRRSAAMARVFGSRMFGYSVGVSFALAWARQIKEVGV